MDRFENAVFDEFFLDLFAVFKMIGREHQARLELPSFGFSKVSLTLTIMDQTKIIPVGSASRNILHFRASLGKH